MDTRLKSFLKTEDWEIYEFLPTLTKLFYKNYEPLTPQRYIRFVLELLKGYQVYYLAVRGDIVAYCVISRGGGRYWFAGKEDIVVGPYFVLPEHRGNHYSEKLVKALLGCGKISYKRAYDWIRKDNIPSLKCSEKVGFVKIGEANLSPWLRRIQKVDKDGNYYILKCEVK